MEFRTLQAISDLRAVARHADADVRAEIVGGDADKFRTLNRLIGERGSRLGEDDVVALYEPLFDTANSPERSQRAFETSVAILLADALQRREPDDAVSCLWLDKVDAIRSASPSVRAAIMNGFERARQLGVADDVCRPRREDLVTMDREAVLAPLVKIAKTMTEAEMQHVSKADYGDEADLHLAALKVVVNSEDCRFPTDPRWIPAEVVELVSHSPSEMGFAPCMALLLIDAICSDESFGSARLRWADNFDWFRTVPDRAYAPILGAFRHLYERIDHWGPLFNRGFTPTEGVTIPWFPV